MVRTDISNLREAKIDTITGILDVLKNYSDKDFEGDTFLQDACKDALGEDWELYKGNREEIINALEKMEPELKVEDAQVTVEEIKMESKALSSEDVKGLLRDFEEELAKQKEAPRGKKAIEDFIQGRKKLTAQQKEQAIKELWPAVEKIEIKKEVELIVGKEVDEQIVDKVVEAIVEEKPIEINTKELGQQDPQEVREEIELLKEEVAAERRIEEQIDNLTREVTQRYEKIIGEITIKEQEELRIGVEKEIEEEVRRPWNKTDNDHSPVKIIKDSAGKITVTVNGEETTPIYENNVTRKGGVVSRPIGQEKAQELSLLEKEVAGRVGELRKSADSAGEELREIREKMLGRGAKLGEVRMVRNLVVTTQDYEETRGVLDDHGFAEKPIAESVQEAKLVAGSIKSGIKNISKLPEDLIKLDERLGGKVKIVSQLSKTATSLGEQFNQIGAVQRITKLQAQINGLNPLKLIPGFEKIASSLGLQSTPEIMAAVYSHIATYGLKEGVASAVKLALANGGRFVAVTATEAGAAAGAGTVAAGGTVAAAAAIPYIGFIIAAVVALIELGVSLAKKAFGFVKDKINGALESMNWDLGELGLKDKFGGLVGGGMELAIYGAAALFAFFAFIQARAIATGAIAAVVIFGFSLVTGSSSLTLNQILPWVANRYVGGGYCVYIGPKETGSGGNINCDQTVDDQGTIGVDKENFIRVAGMWRSGGDVNARLCFNDVVKRAKEANRSPEYALWAWLHESGASNYTGFPEVEDFGIHGLSDDEGVIPPNDFNRQINKFLVLDPASKCPDLAAEDYWVAFSTNYLTGTCDPEIVVNGFTGRTYADELRKTWSWIASIPMPENIGPGGGTIESVEGEGGDGTNLVVVEEEDGLYLCEVMAESTGEVVGNVPLPTLDPNIKIPEGCPEGLPLKASRQSILVNITQGPMCAKYSHKNMDNAVDFGIVAPIIATHNGIARAGSNSVYGYYVDVTGTCQGRTFTTRYAHMPSAPNWTMKEVKKGEVIGMVNNTGNSTGEHLHYDIRGGSLPLKISSYLGLSKDLTGCCDRASCAQ